MFSLKKLMAGAVAGGRFDVTTAITSGFLDAGAGVVYTGFDSVIGFGSLADEFFVNGKECIACSVFQGDTLAFSLVGEYPATYFTSLFVEINSVVTQFDAVDAGHTFNTEVSTWVWASIGPFADITSGDLRVVKL